MVGHLFSQVALIYSDSFVLFGIFIFFDLHVERDDRLDVLFTHLQRLLFNPFQLRHASRLEVVQTCLSGPRGQSTAIQLMELNALC